MWSPSTVVVVIRDLVLLGVGSFGIVYQQISGVINVPLLAVYTAMVGVPGAAGVLKLLRTVPIESGSPTSPPSSSSTGAGP